MADENEVILGQNEVDNSSKHIISGVEIIPYLQKLGESHDSSEKAIAIKIPGVINSFDMIHTLNDAYESERRYSFGGDEDKSIEYIFGPSDSGEDKLIKVVRTAKGEGEDSSTTEEVSDADAEEVNRFFSKYVLQKTQGGDYVLYGGLKDDNINYLEVAEKIDKIHLNVQRTMGTKGRPQIYLYRHEEDEEAYTNRYYIDVIIENKDEETAAQLARTYIEDYELINNTRNRVKKSPSLIKLVDRVDRLKRLEELGAPEVLIAREKSMVEKALQDFPSDTSDLFRVVFDEKIPKVEDIVNAGYNLKKFEFLRSPLQRVEMPYVFREGMARFVGKKLTGVSFGQVMEGAVQTLGGYSSELNSYYTDVLTDEYAQALMPAILWHLSNQYGLSTVDIANAVSKTSHKDFSFESFFKNLDIDFGEVSESWRSELRRYLPK